MEEILKNEVKSFRICIHINDLLNAIFLSVQDLSGSVSLHREKKHWPVRLQTDTSYRMTETSFCLHFIHGVGAMYQGFFSGVLFAAVVF